MATVERQRRIAWTQPIRDAIAKGVAETLMSRQVTFPPPWKEVMRAFRDTQPIILGPDLRRTIQGPSQAIWLRDAVIEAWKSIARPEENPPASPSPDIITADDVGLILDALTGIEQTLAAHAEMLTSLNNAVQALGGDVQGLGKIIIKRKKRQRQAALTPPPCVPVKPVRIAVAGLSTGRQRHEIETRVKGHTHTVTLAFPSSDVSPAQITHFDQLIILEKLMGTNWHKKAEHLYGNRIHLARGITTATELIRQMGANPERFRVD